MKVPPPAKILAAFDFILPYVVFYSISLRFFFFCECRYKVRSFPVLVVVVVVVFFLLVLT